MLSIFVLICRISCFRHMRQHGIVYHRHLELVKCRKPNSLFQPNIKTKLELSIRGKPYIPIQCINEALFWKYRQNYVLLQEIFRYFERIYAFQNWSTRFSEICSLNRGFPLSLCTLNRSLAVLPWMIRHRMLGKAQISLLPKVLLKILKIWIQLWSLTRAGLPRRIDVMVLVVGCFLRPRGWGRWGDQGLHPGRVEAGRGNGLGATKWCLYQVGGHHFATTHSPSHGSDSRGRSARCRPRTRASTW